MCFLPLLLTLAIAVLSRGVLGLSRLRFNRHDCEDCPPQMQENQMVSFRCTLTPCDPGEFSLGFYLVHYGYTGVVPIYTDSEFFPNGSSVNVTKLEGRDCAYVLSFVASDQLNGSVLQCIAAGFHHNMGSIPHIIAMKAHPVDPTITTKKPTTGCNCSTSCADITSVPTSASASSHPFISGLSLLALILTVGIYS